MQKLFNGQVNSFTDFIEKEALNQIESLLEHSFIKKPIAIMPDVHAGKGCTIGSVFITENALIPMSIGVDIGCGMSAWQTSLRVEDLELSPIYQHVVDQTEILRKARTKPLPSMLNAELGFTGYVNSEHYKDLLNQENIEYWRSQVGTLGSGNHFLEISQDENGYLWFIVHSGSRNLGHTIATCAYNRAKELNPVKENIDLSYLTNSDIIDYYTLMLFAVCYANMSRLDMIQELYNIVNLYVKDKKSFHIVQTVNTVHNYAQKLNDTEYLCRKGACEARNNQLVIIPGSMNTKTYICRGLGNIDARYSCPHGAGRRMSRTAARKAFSDEDISSQLAGLQYCSHSLSIIDELPLAYKDINSVIENSKELVSVVHTLTPVINWKGQ